MSEENKGDTPKIQPVGTWSALPETQRGFGLIVHSAQVKDKHYLCYANRALAFLRNMEDPRDVITFSEHKGNVTVVRVSPSGRWVASGDDNGTVIVWELATKKVKIEVPVNQKIHDIVWSPDNKRIIAVGAGGSQKGKAFMWDSGNNVGTISGHSKTILSVDFKPTRPFRAVTTGEDLEVITHTGPPFKKGEVIRDNDRYPNCCRFAPDGSIFVTVSSDKRILSYDGKTGEKKGSFGDDKKTGGHGSSVYSLAWSPKGNQFLTTSADKTAKLWDVESGKCESTFTFRSKPTVDDMQVGSAWSGDNIVTVSLSGALNFLNVETPDTPNLVMHGHKSNVLGMAVSPSLGKVFTCCQEGRVAVWDKESGTAAWLSGKGHGKRVEGVAVANVAGSAHIASVGYDGTIIFSQLGKEGAAGEFGTPALKLGANPRFVVSNYTQAPDAENSVTVVATTKNQVFVLFGDAEASSFKVDFDVTSAAFSPDSKELTLGGSDNNAYSFTVDPSDGQVVNKPTKREVGEDEVTVVTYSPNGNVLMTAAKDRYLSLMQGEKNRSPSGWRYHNAKITDAAFSPDGSRLATVGLDEYLIVFNDLEKFKGKDHDVVAHAHYGGVSAVAWWSKDEIVTIGADRCVRFWKL